MESAGQTTERFLKMIFFILLSSLGVYWVVMQTLHPAARIDPLLRSVLTALAAVTAITIFFVHFVYIEKMLQERAGEASSPKLPRVRQAYIVCYMLCEMVGLFGFVVYVMGGGRHRAALFILAAAALYALCYPQLSKY